MFEPSDIVVQELVRGLVCAGSLQVSYRDLHRFMLEEWPAVIADDCYDPGVGKTPIFDWFMQHCIDGNQNVLVPGADYISVTRVEPAAAIGLGERRYFEPPGANPDRMLQAEHSRDVVGTWDLQWHVHNDFGEERSPFDYAHQFWFFTRSAVGVDLMRLVGLTSVECSDPRDLSFVDSDETYENRAGCDLKLRYRQRYTTEVPTIGHVSVRLAAGQNGDILPNHAVIAEPDPAP